MAGNLITYHELESKAYTLLYQQRSSTFILGTKRGPDKLAVYTAKPTPRGTKLRDLPEFQKALAAIRVRKSKPKPRHKNFHRI